MKLKGQIWVETVVYTLIGLALIGIVLAIVNPRISAAKERIIIEQSIDSLNMMNSKVRDALDFGPGNARVIDEFGIKKGELEINAVEETVIFRLEGLESAYSEPDADIDIGDVLLRTEENQKTYTTTLTLNYSSIANITYGTNRENINKKISEANTPYQFTITNYGQNGALVEINIRETSRA